MSVTELFPSAPLERIKNVEESLQNKTKLMKTVLIPVLLILNKLQPTLMRKILYQKEIRQKKFSCSY